MNHQFWLQRFVAQPGKLAWVVSQAIKDDPKLTDELAFSVFPSLFCSFIEDNVNRQAAAFLMHLVELCAAQIETAIPFLSAFLVGCYAFHDRLWSSLEANDGAPVDERIKRAIKAASPQLHLARPILDRLVTISSEVALNFWISDVLTFSLKCHGMFGDVLEYLENLSVGEARQIWDCVSFYRVTNDTLCVWNVLEERIDLYFKASSLALFLDIAKKYPVVFAENEPAISDTLTFSLIYSKDRPKLLANGDMVVMVPIPNYIVKVNRPEEAPRERSPQEKLLLRLWERIKIITGREHIEPLALLPLVSRSRPLVRFSSDQTKLMSSPEFTEFALKVELERLTKREQEIARSLEMSVLEKMVKARGALMSALLKRVVVSACIGVLGSHFQVQAKPNSPKKIVSAIKGSLHVMDEDKLEKDVFMFPLVVANLNGVTSEPANLEAVMKKLNFDGLTDLRGSILEPGLEVLTQTVAHLKSLLMTFISAPCGYQIEIFLQLAQGIEQTAQISTSYGCPSTETNILLSILPAKAADVTKFLSGVVRVSQISKLLIQNEIEIPELGDLEKPLSWVLGAAAHSPEFIEGLLKHLNVEFGRK